MAKKKLRIGLVFGGRSGEHEVSLASATSVMANLDSDKYEVVPIGITKQGSWLLGTEPARLLETEQSVSASTGTEETTAVTLTGDPSLRRLIPLQSSEQLEDNGALDVILPVLHGTYGEDGALQGLLEMANVPYVGCGVLGSALGMDKEKMKMVFSSVGLPIVDYLVYRRNAWERSPETIMDEASNEFYDYNAKYIDNKSRVIIPAAIPQTTAEEVRRQAIKAFLALDLSGLARVDFFLEKETGQVYINEVNTLPGFTKISMYPQLWEASGLPYSQMLDRLIELAIERHADKQRNRTSR